MMNPKDIREALVCCNEHHALRDCEECPLEGTPSCVNELIGSALDCIMMMSLKLEDPNYVRIVRCSDCIHMSRHQISVKGVGFCKYHSRIVEDEFFCKNGVQWKGGARISAGE